jgi:hypothetical protein
MSNDQSAARWFIDLDWLEQHHRSFLVLAQDYLCPQCRQRLEEGEKEISAAVLLSAIKDCCSKTPGFIAERSPVLESLFRLLLSVGNQPLDLEEVAKLLSERRGDRRRTPPEVLSRLLESDHYYGLRQVA